MAALITTLGAVAVALITRSNRKTRRAVEDVHAEVRTNNGKRAGEYIEDVPTVLAMGLRNMGQVLADALADHTASDAENFEELRTMMQRVESAQRQ